MSAASLLAFARALAAMLAERHALDSHRGDLCPELLSWDGNADLCWSERRVSGATLAAAGQLPPECLQGEDPRLADDARGEVWQAGLLLYEAATGEHPFPDEDAEDRAAAIATEHPPLPGSLSPEIPLEWDPIVACCLHKPPRERFADALDLERELERLEQSGGTRRRAPRRVSGLRIALATLVLLGLLLWFLL